MTASKWFENKVCLVTGGTRGIGRAIAEMLLAEGALVVVSGQRQNSVDRALGEMDLQWPGKVKAKVADVRDCAAVHELFVYVDHAFGGSNRQPGVGLDVLVNNAGIGRFGNVSGSSAAGGSPRGLSVDDWDQTIGTNLSGAFYCSREALFRFGARGGGYIVNISSLAGKNAFTGGAAYNASKFGLNGLSEALMLDVRYENVRVSTILPGSVATAFGRREESQSEGPSEEGKRGGEEGKAGSEEGKGNEAEAWKVHPEDVAAVVRMILLMPERTMVSQIEIRPSQPKRK